MNTIRIKRLIFFNARDIGSHRACTRCLIRSLQLDLMTLLRSYYGTFIFIEKIRCVHVLKSNFIATIIVAGADIRFRGWGGGGGAKGQARVGRYSSP